MHYLIVILFLLAISLRFTLKFKSNPEKKLIFSILVIFDIYISGVLIYFLSSAIIFQ